MYTCIYANIAQYELYTHTQCALSQAGDVTQGLPWEGTNCKPSPFLASIMYA